jgi:hypothetical protein
MSLPPQAEALVCQLVQALGLQSLPLEFLEIHFDKDGVAQKVKPKLTYERRKAPRE